MCAKGVKVVKKMDIGYLSFWHTLTQVSQQFPQQKPGISAHFSQDQYKNIPFKVFFIRLHLKKQRGRTELFTYGTR